MLETQQANHPDDPSNPRGRCRKEFQEWCEKEGVDPTTPKGHYLHRGAYLGWCAAWAARAKSSEQLVDYTNPFPHDWSNMSDNHFCTVLMVASQNLCDEILHKKLHEECVRRLNKREIVLANNTLSNGDQS